MAGKALPKRRWRLSGHTTAEPAVPKPAGRPIATMLSALSNFWSALLSRIAIGNKPRLSPDWAFFYPIWAETKGFGDELEIFGGELLPRRGEIRGFSECHRFVSDPSLTKSRIDGLMHLQLTEDASLCRTGAGNSFTSAFFLHLLPAQAGFRHTGFARRAGWWLDAGRGHSLTVWHVWRMFTA